MNKYDNFQDCLMKATQWAFETENPKFHEGNKQILKNRLSPFMAEVVIRAYNAVLRQKEIDRKRKEK